MLILMPLLQPESNSSVRAGQIAQLSPLPHHGLGHLTTSSS